MHLLTSVMGGLATAVFGFFLYVGSWYFGTTLRKTATGAGAVAGLLWTNPIFWAALISAFVLGWCLTFTALGQR